jgi:tetratricopeptide (TPR) repeat protein
VDRERWRKISEVFDAALERAPGERTAFLEQACAGDVEMRSEVERLLGEFNKAGDFLEKPLATPGQSAAVGDVLDGRYRIEALIGRGGMGEVYRAHDQFMNEPVALKTLRPELTGNPALLKRFQREVQLARRVTHPNVCRVFEVGVHEGEDSRVHYFTMQLLEGETLAARIRRAGPLSKPEAFPLIAQMAAGLQAAHEQGIVHRDFKSSNVMLCGGKAVITDFGLAHLEPLIRTPDATLSATVSLAGTVAYMSPEQLAGQEVTAASDIYSFGIVLYEMATGRLPFDSRHIVHSAMQRAGDSVPDARAVRADLDPRWAAVIGRCLQRDPSRRFSNIGEAAAYLRSSPWRPSPAYWTRRQWIRTGAVAGAGAGTLALLPAVSRFFRQDASLTAGAAVVLSPLGNTTGDARFDGITELFRNQLSQSAHLNLIEQSGLAATLRQMGRSEDAAEPAFVREAAWRLNAVLTVFGSVSRLGPDYALNIQIETRGSQPELPRYKELRTFSAADPAALMRSVRDASLWVREKTGESAVTLATFDRLPADVTTPSWEALSYYARGEQYFTRQQYEPALLEFESALRIDPQFTLAALRRADLLVSRARQAQGFAQWREAIRMLDQRPVTRTEELNARAMFAFDSGDIEANDRYCRTWELEYPADWRGPYFRVIGLILNGHARQALEVLEKLRAMRPDFGDLYAQTIAAHLVLGQVAEARAVIPELRQRNYPERAELREGFARFREGDLTGFLEILRNLERSQNRRSAADAMLHEAMLWIDVDVPAAAAGRVEAFLRSGSRAETTPEESQLRVVQAWAEALQGRGAAAVQRARQALELETGPLIVALAGSVFARMGARTDAEQALKICDPLVDLPLYRIARHRILGELARQRGDGAAALSEFRIAAGLEPRILHRQYLMEALPEGDPERLRLAQNAVAIPWQALRPPPLHCLGSLAVAVPAVLASGGAPDPFAARFADSAHAVRGRA